jgi:hypothetical protein
MVLQFLQNVNSRHRPQIHHQRIGSIAFELLTVSQDNEQTFESNLHQLGIICAQAVDIVSNEIDVLIQVENVVGLSSVGKVAKDIAYFSLDVVSIRFE